MDPVIKIDEYVRVVPDCNVPRKPSKFSKDKLGVLKPLCMFWRGDRIEFKITGLKHPTIQGHRMIHIYEMSDGSNDYRLEFDAEALTWKLISMIPGGASA